MRTFTILFFSLIAVLLTAGTCSDSGDTGKPSSDGGTSDGGTSDGDTDTDSDADTDNDILASGCSEDEKIGALSIYLTEDYTVLSGAIANGVNPSSVPDILNTSGTCSLLGPKNLNCDPSCTTLGTTCGTEGFCIEAPSKQDVGTVTVSGMNMEMVCDPVPITSDYSERITDPYPGYDIGATLTLQAEGGVYSAFTMSGIGPGPIEGAPDTVMVERESPVTLSWTPGGVNGTQMQIKLVVNTHGVTSGWIVCDAPDTGSFQIPAKLVTALIDLGLSGYPKLEFSRRSIDTETIEPGCAEFVIFSKKDIAVEIPGLDSCVDDTECEDGTTCQPDLVCR